MNAFTFLLSFLMGLVWMKTTWCQQNESLLNEASVGIPPITDHNGLSEEKRLTHFLLHQLTISGRQGRPVRNVATPTAVKFGLGLIQMDLDERNKILTCSMWSKLQWRDEYLQWRPEDYGNISRVRLESQNVWIPDIMLFNTADPVEAQRNALVLVANDGTLRWVPHQRFKSSCSLDVTNFPFDNQACHLWFGSWTHTLKEINLTLAFQGGIDLSTFQSDYKDSCVWEIINTTAEAIHLPEGDPDPIAVLTFTLNFRRKIVFSSYILTLPCVFLVMLTLVVFWLPADRPDRIGLAMSLFASFLVLLLILVEAAPPTASSVPVLGVYYCCNMVIIMLSIFLSSLVINIYRAGSNNVPVPPWLRLTVVRGLGRIFCSSKVRKDNESDQYMQVKTSEQNMEGQSRDHFTGSATCLCCKMCQSHKSTSNGKATQLPQKDTLDSGLGNNKSNNINGDERYLCVLSDNTNGQIDKVNKSFIESLPQENSNGYPRRMVTADNLEWIEISRILDRFLCMLFFILIAVTLIVFFPRPPGFFGRF